MTPDRRSIHPYNHTITPTKPRTPSHGASAKLSGTIPIGASFDVPTINPALITPQMLSPTMSPDATSVPSRSARSGFGERRTRPVYQRETIEPTMTPNVADIGRDIPLPTPRGGGGRLFLP